MNNKAIIEKSLSYAENGHFEVLEDILILVKDLEMDGATVIPKQDKNQLERIIYDEHNFSLARGYSTRIRELSRLALKETNDERYIELYKNTLLFDAPHNFDCFCRYIEWDRAAERKFYEPRRKQLKVIADALQGLEDDKYDLVCISLPPGVGKALANDTPVLTRNGWKNHGDLVVGDEVIGLDGQFKKVTAVHPKCMVDCLVEFTNGEQIQCHENHEWLIHDRAIFAKDSRDYVAETKRLAKRKLNSGGEVGHRGHRYVIQLPHKGYVVGEEKELPLDPYTFGVWLGDGVNKMPTICCSAKDKCVIDRVVRNGNEPRWDTVHKQTGVLYFGFGFRNKLQSIGLCHSRRTSPKYIPDVYLTASIEQRLELLAGLIDTDGTRAGSKYQFTTAEESLRDSFIELISTFGWRASVKVTKPTTSSSGITSRKNHYVIGFTPDLVIPCEIERKRNKEPHKQRAIGFKNITRVEPKEGNCITVEGGMYLVGKTMLPTHNSTLALFYCIWVGCRNPEMQVLEGSHTADILRGIYDEMLRVLDPDGEYLVYDVFPDIFVSGQDAKRMRIDLLTRKRFQTFEFMAIGGANSGKVRATKLLYCDDLIDGIETALNRERLDKLWRTYTTDLQQRKQGKYCKELHIATRWSVSDVIGRLEEQYGTDDRSVFIRIPALDADGNSNFDYPYGVGFSTGDYIKQRESMDETDWNALYMNEPIERDGQLFPLDELNRYYTLPDREPDAVYAVVDTKDQGLDYCVAPIVFQYGMDSYIENFVCDNGKMEVVESKIIERFLKYGVNLAQFESNRAGGRSADLVESKIRERGGKTKVTKKWNQANKDTRIYVNSAWIKEHFWFKDDSVIKSDKEYRVALQLLERYTMVGSAKHRKDDVPDALSQLAEFVQQPMSSTIEVRKRPF